MAAAGLGLALGQSLVQQGLTVYGTKQSVIDAQALATFGIHGLPLVLPVDVNQLDNQQKVTLQQAFASDLLVINVHRAVIQIVPKISNKKYRAYRILQNKLAVKKYYLSAQQGFMPIAKAKSPKRHLPHPIPNLAMRMYGWKIG